MKRVTNKISLIYIAVVFAGMIFFFWGCYPDADLPGLPVVNCDYATNITSTSALINNIGTENNYCVNNPVFGIVYSTTSAGLDDFGHFSENSYSNYVQLKDLQAFTTYFYKPYIKDGLGNYIYGEVKSFTTLKKVNVTITTGSGYNDGYYYDSFYSGYRYHFILFASITGVDEVSVFGIEVSSSNITSSMLTGSTGTFSLSSDGTYEQEWTTTTSGTRYYRAYVRLKTGSYIFGEVRSVYVH